MKPTFPTVLVLGLGLLGCATARPTLPPSAVAARASQVRAADAPVITRLLVNGKPAWDYESADENDTMTCEVLGPDLASIRWTTDAGLVGPANQSRVRIRFYWGGFINRVGCTVRDSAGREETREFKVIVRKPYAPSFPPVPVPPFPRP